MPLPRPARARFPLATRTNAREVRYGRSLCGDLAAAETREWLLTNGRGGYAMGTVAGTLTRRYHGLLIAAFDPPVDAAARRRAARPRRRLRRAHVRASTNRWRSGRDRAARLAPHRSVHARRRPAGLDVRARRRAARRHARDAGRRRRDRAWCCARARAFVARGSRPADRRRPRSSRRRAARCRGVHRRTPMDGGATIALPASQRTLHVVRARCRARDVTSERYAGYMLPRETRARTARRRRLLRTC